MLPIANKPMLLYGLEHLRNAGITEIGVILGPITEGIIDTFGDGSGYGVELTYIKQPEPRGLAHAVLISEEFLGDSPFVMYLGDNLLKQGVKPMVELFKETDSDCVVGTTQVDNPGRYGVIVFDEDDGGEVQGFVEKPKEFVSDWALIGIYIFNEKVFKAVRGIEPSWRGELEITDTIQRLLEWGSKIRVQRVQGWWKDTGRPEDLLEANQLILRDLEPYNKGRVEDSATITDRVGIGEATIIHSRTTIRGPAIIGDHSVIGPNTYIGPYTSIGDHCHVINTEIENSIVMEGCHLDCGKRITDSLIGREVEVSNHERMIPRGHKLILGDQSKVNL
jgi:glucose-1-phosphate thymidylyltransferase